MSGLPHPFESPEPPLRNVSSYLSDVDPGDENTFPHLRVVADPQPTCRKCDRVLFGEWVAGGLCKHCDPDMLEAI